LLFQGDLKAAQSILGRAWGDYLPERDGETRDQFGRDTGVSAAAYLALAEWLLGEVERARQLIDWATRRANELGHAASIANALHWKTVIEAFRNDAAATRLAADSVLRLTEERGIKTYADVGRVFANWARGRLDDPEAGARGLRQALTAYVAQG
jgi:hypothetical protein